MSNLVGKFVAGLDDTEFGTDFVYNSREEAVAKFPNDAQVPPGEDFYTGIIRKREADSLLIAESMLRDTDVLQLTADEDVLENYLDDSLLVASGEMDIAAQEKMEEIREVLADSLAAAIEENDYNQVLVVTDIQDHLTDDYVEEEDEDYEDSDDSRFYTRRTIDLGESLVQVRELSDEYKYDNRFRR